MLSPMLAAGSVWYQVREAWWNWLVRLSVDLGCLQYADDTQLYLNIPLNCKGLWKSWTDACIGWLTVRLNPSDRGTVGGVFNKILGSGCILMMAGVAFISSVICWQVALQGLGLLLDSQDLVTVIHALVMSQLVYWNVLYMGLPLETSAGSECGRMSFGWHVQVPSCDFCFTGLTLAFSPFLPPILGAG